MEQQFRYVQWHFGHGKKRTEHIADAVRHWEERFELGSAVLICEDPHEALKIVKKQWRKLCIHAQKERNQQLNAESMLTWTRKVSRMQRVRFSSKNPEADAGAIFYVVSFETLKSLPANCFTVYMLTRSFEKSFIEKLPSDALIVTTHKEVANVSGLLAKSVLEEKIQTKQADLFHWLKSKKIDIELLVDGDMEQTNEVLDDLLTIMSLQEEFLLRVKIFFRELQLAQPIQLSEAQEQAFRTIQSLEHHVKILTPAYISDHIIDSSREDAFLLRDIFTGENVSAEMMQEIIEKHHREGNENLAKALERTTGFIRI